MAIKALRFAWLIRDTFFLFLFSYFFLLYVALRTLSFQAKHNNNERHLTRTRGNILQGQLMFGISLFSVSI